MNMNPSRHAIPPELPCPHCGRMPSTPALPLTWDRRLSTIGGPDGTVRLTDIRGRLFDIFAETPGRIRTYDELEARIYADTDEIPTSALKVHICYLRRALRATGAPVSIVTYYGEGYALIVEPHRPRGGR